MKTIWKFTCPVTDTFSIPMPLGAELLHLDTQDGEPRLWALLDQDAVMELRHFVLVGTGHPMGDGTAELHYVGTVQAHGGALVWHLFEFKPVLPDA